MTWSGFGFTYDQDTYERFVAWAEQQDNLPDDEQDQMALWEEYMADEHHQPPTRQEPEYRFEVMLANTFEAKTALEAVAQMIEWLQDVDLWGVSYRVQREHQDAIDYIDASDAYKEAK